MVSEWNLRAEHALPALSIRVTEPLGTPPVSDHRKQVRGVYGFVSCLTELVDKFILTRDQGHAISAQSRRYSASKRTLGNTGNDSVLLTAAHSIRCWCEP